MVYEDLEMPEKGDTVVVGMSGGVDSTITAMLLKKIGCNVIGATMSLWDGKIPEMAEGKKLRDSCYGPAEEKNIADCKKFCEEQNIPYYVVDVKEDYAREVLEYFKSEYRAGRTPNPCIRCNRYVKFGALLSGLRKLGVDYDYFCTGHYAKLVRGTESISSLYGDGVSCAGEGNSMPPQIACAMDVSKDQAYFLYRIPTEILEKVRFPLSKYTKKEVFELARSFNLSAADRSESQDFVPEEYKDMLFSDKPSVPGDIIDMDGKVLGRHRGIEHYTIGQRRGLGVSAAEPLYVAEIDSANNYVVLGKDSDLFCGGLIADDIVWPGNYDPGCSFSAMVKIRLASKPVEALVEPYEVKEGETFTGRPYKISFAENQRAVAPGQSVVFYRDGIICGGGIIHSALKV